MALTMLGVVWLCALTGIGLAAFGIPPTTTTQHTTHAHTRKTRKTHTRTLLRATPTALAPAIPQQRSLHFGSLIMAAAAARAAGSSRRRAECPLVSLAREGRCSALPSRLCCNDDSIFGLCNTGDGSQSTNRLELCMCRPTPMQHTPYTIQHTASSLVWRRACVARRAPALCPHIHTLPPPSTHTRPHRTRTHACRHAHAGSTLARARAAQSRAACGRNDWRRGCESRESAATHVV